MNKTMMNRNALPSLSLNGLDVRFREGKPEDHAAHALLVPEDRNLVMGPVEPLVAEPGEEGDYVLHRMAVEAAQAAPQDVGNIIKQRCDQGNFPLVMKLVVYDFSQKSFVRPLWVQLTLMAALGELIRFETASISLGALGCSHGGISPRTFGGLLVDTLFSLPADASLKTVTISAQPLALRSLAKGAKDQLRMRLH